MANLKITYADKDKHADPSEIISQFRDNDANEIKHVVNSLSDLVSTFIEKGGDVVTKSIVVFLSGEISYMLDHDFPRFPVLSAYDSSGAEVSVAPVNVTPEAVYIDFGEAFSGVLIAM